MKKSLNLLAILSLSACAMGTDYKKPPVTINKDWSGVDQKFVQVADKSAAQTPWWTQFHDDNLNQLMQKTLANNNDLKIAAARIAEAQADERLAFATLLPQINATGNYGRATVNQTFFNGRDTTTQAGISGDWELDVFGANRRRREAAVAGVEAAMAAENNTRLTLIAEVAQNYIQLRSGQEQHALTEKNLTMQNDTLTITKGQRSEGAISDFEVARAAAQVNETAARLPQIDRAITAAANRLCILAGLPPGSLNPLVTDDKPVPMIATDVVIATPVATIAKRPDIRAAERQLAQAAALSNAAFADFFPKISLQGFFGFQHSELFGSESPWSAAINGLFPLLDFGRIRSQLNAADARQQQSFYTYQQTVLLALEDTENALSAYVNEQKRRETLEQAAIEQARAADIANEQYKAGVATQLDLLIAEQNRLNADNDLAQSKGTAAANLALLYRALGDDGQATAMANTDIPPAPPPTPVQPPAMPQPVIETTPLPEADATAPVIIQ